MTDVNTPDSATLRWAIICSRILIIPTVIEMLVAGSVLLMLAIDSQQFNSYLGITVVIASVGAGLHGAFSAACVLLGWRMHRARNQQQVPRWTAIGGALAGITYFLLSALVLLAFLSFTSWQGWQTVELVVVVGTLTFFFIYMWPALFFVILCIKMRWQAPPPGAVSGSKPSRPVVCPNS